MGSNVVRASGGRGRKKTSAKDVGGADAAEGEDAAAVAGEEDEGREGGDGDGDIDEKADDGGEMSQKPFRPELEDEGDPLERGVAETEEAVAAADDTAVVDGDGDGLEEDFRQAMKQVKFGSPRLLFLCCVHCPYYPPLNYAPPNSFRFIPKELCREQPPPALLFFPRPDLAAHGCS